MNDKLYCRSCKAPYRFVVMASGKSMPVDWNPVVIVEGEGHNKYVTAQGRVTTGRPRQKGGALSGLRRVFTPHWATCPNADQHRKR